MPTTCSVLACENRGHHPYPQEAHRLLGKITMQTNNSVIEIYMRYRLSTENRVNNMVKMRHLQSFHSSEATSQTH